MFPKSLFLQLGFYHYITSVIEELKRSVISDVIINDNNDNMFDQVHT